MPDLVVSQGRSPQRVSTAYRRRYRRGVALFALFAFPNLALIAVFAYWPVLENVYLSLTSWDFISPAPLFIGLENYIQMFTSGSFLSVLRITPIWVVVVVGLCLVLGIAVLDKTSWHHRGHWHRGKRVPEAITAIQAVYSGGSDPESTLAAMQETLEPAIDRIRPLYEERVER